MLCEPFPFILEQTYVDYCIGMKYAQCTLIRTCVVDLHWRFNEMEDIFYIWNEDDD